jgi:hypothetical protein
MLVLQVKHFGSALKHGDVNSISIAGGAFKVVPSLKEEQKDS